MTCSEVGHRLVAWRDGELGASEQRLLEEHVDRCPACAEADRRLRAALPRPRPLAPPREVRDRLARALDPELILALAERPAPARIPSWTARWRRPVSVSAGTALVYLALLAGTFGWGLSNWWSLRASAPSLRPPASGAGIPAEQFRPASYAPGAPGSPGSPSDGSAPGAPTDR